MSRFMRPRFVVVAVAIVAIVTAAAYLYVNRNGNAVQYRTAAAVLGTVTQTIPISGNLTPVTQTDLDFAGSGKVKTVNVQAGQAVKAGDILASLDPVSLQGSLVQAQAALTSAQAKLSLDQAGPTAQSLNQAQSAVNTAQVQLQSDTTSQQDTIAVNAQMVQQAQGAQTDAQSKYNADGCGGGSPASSCPQDQSALNTAQNNYQAALVKQQQSNDQAQSQVNRDKVSLLNAQAALAVAQQGPTTQQVQIDQSQVSVDQVNVDSAQRALDNATLTAPGDGVVSAVNIVVGQATASGTNAAASSTTHAISILTPGAYTVIGSVSDAQVGQIAVGQAARITPAGATEALTGKVTGVAAVATVTSGVATFGVTVTINGSNPSLHAGTSASVAIIVNQASEVLTIPTSALRGGTAVQVLVNGKPQTRIVTVGASDALRTQIMSGLTEGDEVITATVSSTVPSTNSGNGLFGGGGGRGNFGGGGGRGGGGVVVGG